RRDQGFPYGRIDLVRSHVMAEAPAALAVRAAVLEPVTAVHGASTRGAAAHDVLPAVLVADEALQERLSLCARQQIVMLGVARDVVLVALDLFIGPLEELVRDEAR